MEHQNVQAAIPVGREEGGRSTMHGRSVEVGRIGAVVGSEELSSPEGATRRALTIERREGCSSGRRWATGDNQTSWEGVQVRTTGAGESQVQSGPKRRTCMQAERGAGC